MRNKSKRRILKGDNSYALFSDSKRYKVGSKAYVNRVYETYELLPPELAFKNLRKEVEFTKEELEEIKQISDAIRHKKLDLDLDVFEKSPEIAKDIYNQFVKVRSGEFMRERNYNYKSSYLDMLEDMNMPQKYIDIIDNMSLKDFINISELLPHMRDYYKALKTGKYSDGKKADINFIESEFEIELELALKESGYVDYE